MKPALVRVSSSFPQAVLNRWQQGYDTYEIAWQLHADEHQIYNALHRARELLRQGKAA